MKNSKAILQVPGTMKIISAEIPVPKEDEVLIKVEYVGICGSDVHGFESGPFIPPKDPNQEIGLGHECAGTVVAVGSRVRKFKPGDRVNIEPGVPCGHCRYCLEGKYNICPDVDFMATQPNYRGALTHYLCHPESFTYKLPDNMDTMEGALVEPAAVGMHAAMLADVKPGKKIIILGAGCIGLMTLQACKCLGATEIAVVDVLEKRLIMAEQLGATVVINGTKEDTIARCQQFTEDMGADIVFETAGSAVTIKQAPYLVMRGGKIMIVGTVPGDSAINFLKINREVTIQTVFRYANRYPVTIEAISSGRFDVKSMVTHIYDYRDVQQAFEESVNNVEKKRRKVMISDIRYWENDATNKHYAIAHFNVWNAEMLMGVIDAAEEAKSPVIISFGTGFVGNTSFEDFSHMMVSMAQKATVPVITHWDHGRSMEIIHNAWTHGMNSLMRDASAFDFEENIRLTKEAVDFFHPLGIPVEAELGHVGNETVYEEALAGYHYTDPDQAAEFVERTGCDSLAVAIGNQHGVYTSEPQLNFEVVKRVRDAVSVPLVLHGASGISDADIKTAISLGIAKINIHTELCQAAMVAVKENQDQPFLHLEREVRKAVKERALEKIKLFGSDGKAE